MIVSASYKTDIPAFYGEWFAKRLKAGFARVKNPYGGPPFTVSLKPEDVDGFVFWTRNAEPFLPVLKSVQRRGMPFYIQYGLLGYPAALDRSTIEAPRAINDIGHLTDAFGPGRVVWRYDPVVLSSLTPMAWHEHQFGRIAAALEGKVDEVVVSFLQVYRKTARNLNAAARDHGFSWEEPIEAAKVALLTSLKGIAAHHGMTLTVCGQPEFLDVAGEARCIDPARLSRVAGREIAAPSKSHRSGCACAASRDIGAYDTCLGGCAYCYAVASRKTAQANHARHDPEGEFLIS